MPEPEQRNQPSRGRSRLEDEVLEILYRAEQPTSLADHLRRKARRQRAERLATLGAALGRLPRRAGSGTMLAAALGAALLGVLVRDTSALLATLLAVVSIGCLLWPIIDRVRRPQPPTVKRWRGRDIEPEPEPPPWLRNLRDRFRKPPRR